MDTQTQEPVEMGTKPIVEHAWLQKLVGEWRIESEMWMGPDQPRVRLEGTETVKSLGGLWAFAERTGKAPNGILFTTYATLGYDVSFREYRGCWFGSMSSHLWNQVGTLSADGKVMTLDCVGPDMAVDGQTANYREVIEIIDDNHRTLTSSGQDETGEWQEYWKFTYTRI
ncbi:MAG TPA: DUF1579 domain-containing protein [Capsulimonadaceae bacterium]|nr:DUF1579 domain-containing protein [Capsulimonadaceae bacterium]